MNNERFYFIFSIIAVAALSRLVPHPENVTPIAAMALFSGAQIAKKSLAYLLPLAAMLISDLFIGFHSTMFFVYIAMMITVMLGNMLAKKITVINVAGVTFASSVIFFIITNLGVWFSGEIYPYNYEGLVACFIAAIPFFANSMLGDLFFSSLLFGGFLLAERKFLKTAS